MKYKQKLRIVEAFQYMGDYNRLSAWFLANSPHSTLPFFWSGRELFSSAGGSAIHPGDYLILSADTRTVSIKSKEDFEASYGRTSEKKK